MGVIFNFNNKNEIKDQLKYQMLIAKHVKTDLEHVPNKNSRCFFVSITKIDGKLGCSLESNNNDLIVEQGASFGVCKTADLEWPNVFARGIDINPSINNNTASNLIINELYDPNLNIREVGYTNENDRFTTEALNLIGGDLKNKYVPNSNDVWFVSGGAKGITALCAIELCKISNGGTYILMGRSALKEEPNWSRNFKTEPELKKNGMMHLKKEFNNGGPKPTPKTVNKLVNSILSIREINETMSNIKKAGGKVLYTSGDVADESSVRKAIGNYSITGVIHGSGVLRDKLIQDKKPEEFDIVYDTKIKGLKAILNSININNLKHICVFSSLAGFHGNKGQIDYSMANEVLNKSMYAIQAKYPQINCKALDFGPWDGGMVNATLKKHFQSMGVQIIDRPGGAESVARTMYHTGEIQCLYGNWGLPAVNPLLKSKVIKKTINAKNNEFLKSHTIKNKLVVPMMNAISYLADVVVGTYPGYSLLSIENGSLFRGVSLDNEYDSIDCEIKLTEQNSDKQTVFVNAELLIKQSSGRFAPAYRCQVVLGVKKNKEQILKELEIRNSNNINYDLNKNELYNGTVLFHGKDFQSIDGVINYNDDGLLASCTKISDSIKSNEFSTTSALSNDGFVLDTAFQLMLVWVRKITNNASLPNHITAINYFKKMELNQKYFVTIIKSSDVISKGDTEIHKAKLFFHSDKGEVFVSSELSVTGLSSLSY